jgi:hypothetical protein
MYLKIMLTCITVTRRRAWRSGKARWKPRTLRIPNAAFTVSQKFVNFQPHRTSYINRPPESANAEPAA